MISPEVANGITDASSHLQQIISRGDELQAELSPAELEEMRTLAGEVGLAAMETSFDLRQMNLRERAPAVPLDKLEEFMKDAGNTATKGSGVTTAAAKAHGATIRFGNVGTWCLGELEAASRCTDAALNAARACEPPASLAPTAHGSWEYGIEFGTRASGVIDEAQAKAKDIMDIVQQPGIDGGLTINRTAAVSEASDYIERCLRDIKATDDPEKVKIILADLKQRRTSMLMDMLVVPLSQCRAQCDEVEKSRSRVATETLPGLIEHATGALALLASFRASLSH